MIPIGPLQATAASAAQAYGQAEAGRAGEGASGFGATMQNLLQDALQTGHAAEAQSLAAAQGGGNITDVVTAVSKAELALQTTVAVRDRVVQAYQDIMRMPI